MAYQVVWRGRRDYTGKLWACYTDQMVSKNLCTYISMYTYMYIYIYIHMVFRTPHITDRTILRSEQFRE